MKALDSLVSIPSQDCSDYQFAVFHAMFDSAPTAMALIEADGYTLIRNEKFNKLEERLKISPVSLFTEHLIADCEFQSIDHFLGKKKHRSLSVHIDKAENISEQWFDFSLTKIPVAETTTQSCLPSAEEYFTLISIIDRTREKQYQEERRLNIIRQMANDNKFVHSMQEVMMATLHQMQGPLNMIDSAVTILKQRNHSCPGLVAMDEAMQDANRALDDIHQAIPERANEASQPVNVNQIVRDAITISTDLLLSHSTEIEFRPAMELQSVNGKPNRLLLAVKQLLDNAVDAIEQSNNSQRAILLATTETEDEVIITIEDSGNGIEDNIRLKMFKPFFSTKSKISSGCRGIGLPIVQQVINEHSATIEISESSRLEGASIQLIFPKMAK
ncbi:HAMP domain-containing histidine kinase [Vibrio sp. JC009]|uniref:sensor histidine kinase n=1 Tax=Vibrio sp. JC009 TaxID=2912314 RepID=UPI0023AF1305|nr:HAMP domain-containing sensor histidine kinase [Vibrio sp. JC009]WED24102.1 HAMP domain-containing histidine kinase [Vibrio sp. JC009]